MAVNMILYAVFKVANINFSCNYESKCSSLLFPAYSLLSTKWLTNNACFIILFGYLHI